MRSKQRTEHAIARVRVLCDGLRMRRLSAKIADLEGFAEQLDGPLGAALRSTGAELLRKLRDQGLTWSDLDDHQIADLFLNALLAAAPAAYPHLARQVVEAAVLAMGENVKMELAANACSTEARH